MTPPDHSKIINKTAKKVFAPYGVSNKKENQESGLTTMVGTPLSSSFSHLPEAREPRLMSGSISTGMNRPIFHLTSATDRMLIL